MADESLTLEGRKYVSSGRAGRLYGYTKDYVGQLCRAGKLDAQLIGRSWYVSEDSIRKHKLGVHYTLKNPQKTRSVNIKKNENTSSKKAFSDDSREMLPRYKSVSGEKKHVSVRPLEQLPHYAEIPIEQEQHTSVIEADNADLFPVPRRNTKLLDPLARADIRYEAYASTHEGETQSNLEEIAQPNIDNTGAVVANNALEVITSIPIRSNYQGGSRPVRSVSGMRVVNTINKTVHRNPHSNKHISFNNGPRTKSLGSQKVPIDGILPTSSASSRRKSHNRSMGTFLNDTDHVDQFQSEYGHRPLSHNHKNTVESRRRSRSFAVPVLGALIVFATFVLLYLLFF